MTNEPATAPPLRGVALLERATNYARGVLHTVTPELTSRPTPCAGWNVATLLDHLDDSLTALRDAVDLEAIELEPDRIDLGSQPAAAVRDHAGAVLGAWVNAEAPRTVAIGGCPLATGIVAAAGALELAVHGWDLAVACGAPRPIPPVLAAELLELVPLLVTSADRPARFAAPATVSSLATPSDRLVGFLGRHPT